VRGSAGPAATRDEQSPERTQPAAGAGRAEEIGVLPARGRRKGGGGGYGYLVWVINLTLTTTI
jgi:hypothetical protein